MVLRPFVKCRNRKPALWDELVTMYYTSIIDLDQNQYQYPCLPSPLSARSRTLLQLYKGDWDACLKRERG